MYIYYKTKALERIRNEIFDYVEVFENLEHFQWSHKEIAIQFEKKVNIHCAKKVIDRVKDI